MSECVSLKTVVLLLKVLHFTVIFCIITSLISVRNGGVNSFTNRMTKSVKAFRDCSLLYEIAQNRTMSSTSGLTTVQVTLVSK
jgi:hypothetical protein